MQTVEYVADKEDLSVQHQRFLSPYILRFNRTDYELLFVKFNPIKGLSNKCSIS